MKKNAYNPFLPSWEYVPDGEPYVFDGRVYLFGSHDRFGGLLYCVNDYVCWSAPVDDLSDWRYEGVTYRKTDDPLNPNGQYCLNAPDVTKGPDGRYYLYYQVCKHNRISVAVCDTPAGRYSFYGYVQYPDGTFLGEALGDEPQFDPGVHTEGDRTYLYTGFSSVTETQRHGAMATVLGADMITVLEAPRFVIPNTHYSVGTSFEGHGYFEAPSMRKIGDTYYLIYSSQLKAELCYATSKSPTDNFVYGGAIISNNDVGMTNGKPAEKPLYFGGNNHGSIVEIAGQWYVFYHRHSNGSNFSRRACAEPITVLSDGRIEQVEMTSCGLNGKPLPGKGEYSVYIACNLFTTQADNAYTGNMGDNGMWVDARFPILTQETGSLQTESFVLNMQDGAHIGFKYFDFKGTSRITVSARGYCNQAVLQVKTEWNGPVIGEIALDYSCDWMEHTADIAIPDGVHALYFAYRGSGNAAIRNFTLE